MNRFIGIVIGWVLLVTPVYTWIIDFAGFGTAALSFLKGGIVWMLILIGAISLVLGLSSLRD